MLAATAGGLCSHALRASASTAGDGVLSRSPAKSLCQRRRCLTACTRTRFRFGFDRHCRAPSREPSVLSNPFCCPVRRPSDMAPLEFPSVLLSPWLACRICCPTLHSLLPRRQRVPSTQHPRILAGGREGGSGNPAMRRSRLPGRSPPSPHLSWPSAGLGANKKKCGKQIKSQAPVASPPAAPL